jgi:hypothetical protein
VPIDDLLQSNGKKAWRRTPKKYCSKRCKRDSWILVQAAKILFRLEPAKLWEILHAITEYRERPRNTAAGARKPNGDESMRVAE